MDNFDLAAVLLIIYIAEYMFIFSVGTQRDNGGIKNAAEKYVGFQV